MKWSFLLFSSFLCLQAIAQYPATGNKMRLGWQTTGDGLVYRGATGDTATLDPSGLNNAWMLLDTANGNLYAYRAKAWQLVSGGGGLTMPFNSVTFNVNETDASERELQYSEEKGYLQYGGLDSVQIPLLPGIWYVRNDTSVTIPKGTVVRATGTLGTSGRIKVKHMIANGSIDAMYVLGIAMQDIAVGADGYVMTQGKIRQINTQAYSEGAVLYADVDTLGGLTQTEPTGSNLKLPIAFVVHSASNGTLAVRVSPGTYLRDLHDAYITSPASNASLYYNTSESVWRDTTGAVLTSDTSVFARDFQISGTANRLAMFTGSNTVGNSVMSQNSDTILNVVAPNASVSTSRFVAWYQNTPNYFTGYPFGTRYYSMLHGSSFASFSFGGTASNNAHLQLTSWTGSGSNFYSSRLVNNSTGDLGFYLSPLASDANPTMSATPHLMILNGGNVGIGTVSPLSTPVGIGLTLGTTSSGRSLYMVSSSDGNNGLIQFKDQNGADALQIAGTSTSNWLYGYGSRPLRFFTNATEVMRIEAPLTGLGNVGIHTSSPSRPLHVAGTTAIRIPVGNFAQRGTSDNGDIRVRTDTASMEYYSGAWRTVAPMARVPQSGLANRFSKFDANGLLDTSAVLVQANGRIGIWNSPAAGDSALTITGGIRTTTSIRTGSDAIINGMTVGVGASNVASNLAFGTLALASWSSTTTGTNIAIGSEALRSATTGSSNTAIGGNALKANTNTSNNIAIGSNALTSYTQTVPGGGSGENIAIGGDALFFLKKDIGTAVSGNTAIGLLSMAWGVNSNANTCIGGTTMTRAQGQENIAIGNASLASSADGLINYRGGINRNVSIGAGAMQFATNNTIANTAIGFGALQRSGFGGDSCVYIGAFSNSSDTSADNEIVIGATAVGNGSNTTTIGNSRTTNTVIPAGSLTVDVMRRKAPVTVTDTFHTVANSTSWLICNRSAGSVTLTLPNAASWAGREIMIKTIQPQAVISASSNVVPIDGVATGTAILPATDGAWCTLVSDGTNWIIMQRGS